VLGYAPGEAALEELEAERANDVVVWFGMTPASPSQPHELLDILHEIHGAHRHPTLINLHGRPDRDRLLKVLTRLGMPTEHGSVVMIGNRPVAGNLEKVKEMKASGKLAELLGSIGWNEQKKASGKGWKPKHAKYVKKPKTEVEHALEVAKRK
jgi:hypothetical protein